MSRRTNNTLLSYRSLKSILLLLQITAAMAINLSEDDLSDTQIHIGLWSTVGFLWIFIPLLNRFTRRFLRGDDELEEEDTADCFIATNPSLNDNASAETSLFRLSYCLSSTSAIVGLASRFAHNESAKSAFHWMTLLFGLPAYCIGGLQILLIILLCLINKYEQFEVDNYLDIRQSFTTEDSNKLFTSLEKAQSEIDKAFTESGPPWIRNRRVNQYTRAICRIISIIEKKLPPTDEALSQLRELSQYTHVINARRGSTYSPTSVHNAAERALERLERKRTTHQLTI